MPEILYLQALQEPLMASCMHSQILISTSIDNAHVHADTCSEELQTEGCKSSS